MNRLPRPAIDDGIVFAALAANAALNSYPSLQAHAATVQAAYAQYVAVNGDLTQIQAAPLPLNIEAYLKGHYASPPQTLGYIEKMRLAGDTASCPMCGSLASGTLDHMMPITPYPVFSIYSLNLVPACKCNSKRGTTTAGALAGERILHPYFDDVLAKRLLTAKFEDLNITPRISLEILLPAAHPAAAAVRFHIGRIVGRTQIKNYLSNEWIKLLGKPSRTTTQFRRNPPTRHALVKILRDERERTDGEGLNNWQSVFFSGLLRPSVSSWLFDQFSRPGRRPDAPLV